MSLERCASSRCSGRPASARPRSPSPSPRLLRARGEDPVAVSADALQVYAGLETLTGVASPAEQALLEHRLLSFVPLDATFSAGQYAQLAHAEIDELLAAGRRPIVVGGTGLYLRAALAELDLRPPPPEGVRERWQAELERRGPGPLHALLAERAPWAAAEIDPNDRQRIVRALELLDLGRARAARGAVAALERRAAPPDAARRSDDGARGALRGASTSASSGCSQRARARRSLRADAAGASETARKALGFEELLAGDVERMKRRTRNYAKRQLTWMRKLAGRAPDRRRRRTPRASPGDPRDADGWTPALSRPPAAATLPGRRPPCTAAAMRFEKWQALGNDYLIVERDELPFELTPARVRRICDAHFGVFADGILLLSAPAEPQDVADLRIFNPDGSEAELSGNGAREAILYLRRRGWTDARQLLDRHRRRAGSARRSPGRTRCRVDMGLASLASPDFPGGPPDGRGQLERRTAATGASATSRSATPNARSASAPRRSSQALDLGAVGPADRSDPRFPNRTNVSWYAELASAATAEQAARIRARIFERGVGETLSSGTGASGAAVAYAEDQQPRPGTATVVVSLDGGELEVEVGEDLHVTLTGWARPVFAGRLSDDFEKELHETE